MRKFLFVLLAAFLMVSCKNYIESYEDICTNAQVQLKAASSPQEVRDIMKQFRADIHELNEENPEEYRKYINPDKENKEVYKVYARRVNMYNAVYGLSSRILKKMRSEGK